jgi:5'-nucleotidase
MRILISNDDGENSPGLKVLIEFAKKIADEVFVIVPSKQRSAGGHGITIDKPISIKEKGQNFFTSDGTPADCVILGLHHILKDKKPDFVFSGVNIDSNLCDHVFYSGTVAVAREAALHRIKAIAFSQEIENGPYENCDESLFEISKNYLPEAFEIIKNLDFTDALYNVNFPKILKKSEDSNFEFTKLGRFQKHESALEMRISPRNSKYFWRINKSKKFEINLDDQVKTDAEVISSGKISITRLDV